MACDPMPCGCGCNGPCLDSVFAFLRVSVTITEPPVNPIGCESIRTGIITLGQTLREIYKTGGDEGWDHGDNPDCFFQTGNFFTFECFNAGGTYTLNMNSAYVHSDSSGDLIVQVLFNWKCVGNPPNAGFEVNLLYTGTIPTSTFCTSPNGLMTLSDVEQVSGDPHTDTQYAQLSNIAFLFI